jgi:hypothetical protein
MSKGLRALFMAAALSCAAASAHAEDQTPLRDGESLAHLTKAMAAPTSNIIDGRVWQCNGDTCYAGPQDAATSQPLRYECQNAAQVLGAFRDYQTGRKAMSSADLTSCNAKAKP